MQENYLSFLNFRAAQRRLKTKFVRPNWLILHALVLVTIMTGIWLYGNVYRLWMVRDYLIIPAWIGFAWSLLFVAHALWTYRGSAARAERRDEVIESEVRQFVVENAVDISDRDLIAMHQHFDAELEAQGRVVKALAAFALVNGLSWFITVINMGTSFAFQLTLPIAVVVITAVLAYLNWQQHRQENGAEHSWFTRLPLRHVLVYPVGIVILWLVGAMRLANPWDTDSLVQGWGLLLLGHIAVSIVLKPLRQWLNRLVSSADAKSKRSERLLLHDDGELLEFVSDELDDDFDQQLTRQS